MKKILCVLILAITATVGCIEKTDKNTADNNVEKLMVLPTCQTTIKETLNGIDSTTAANMISEFGKNVYKKQKLKKLNFWFKKSVVVDILTVIKAEKSAGIKVDGIRIYFVGDPKNPTNKSILLVTTTGSGIDSLPHKDYYSHCADAALFSNQDRFGQYFDSTSADARLYTIQNGNEDDLNCAFGTHPNYILRDSAKNMVKRFGNANINTKAEWLPTQVFQDIADDVVSDGMRIYYAGHSAKPNKQNNKNRDAFVIVTTKPDPKNSSNHIDFFYCTKSAEKLNNKMSAAPKVPFKINSVLTAAQDNGGLCPNNCN